MEHNLWIIFKPCPEGIKWKVAGTVRANAVRGELGKTYLNAIGCQELHSGRLEALHGGLTQVAHQEIGEGLGCEVICYSYHIKRKATPLQGMMEAEGESLSWL